MNPDLTPGQLDLLLALTDGSLAGVDLARTEAVVAADPILAAEYALQREALAFLAAESAAPLADFEAARLRRVVLDSVAPQPARPSPRWAIRLLPVAAALAVVVIGIAFVNGRSGDTEGLDQSASLYGDTTAAATAEAGKDGAPEASSVDDALEEGIEAPTALQAESVRMAELPGLGAFGPDDLPGFAEHIAEYVGEKGYVATPLFDLAPNCDGVEVDGEMLLEYTLAATATWDGLDVLVLEMTEAGGPIVVIDPVTCEVIHHYSAED